MGLFSSKKQTYVSSSAYNMAGEASEFVEYLKSTVARSVLANEPSIADSIVKGQFDGPTMDQRSWFRWARNNYPQGEVTGSISGFQALNATQVAQAANIITKPPGHTVSVDLAFQSRADIAYFAERYMIETYPELMETDWVSDYVPATGEMQILFEDTTSVLLPVPDFDPSARYIMIYYNIEAPTGLGPWTQVSSETGLPSDPDLSGDTPAWVETSNTTVSTAFSLDTTEVVEEDSGSGWVETSNTTSSQNVSEDIITRVLERTVVLPTESGLVAQDEEKITLTDNQVIVEDTVVLTEPDTPVAGTTRRTTTVTQTVQSRLDMVREFRRDVAADFSTRGIHIYEIGSGSASLDALLSQTTAFPEFYPVIMLRRENLPVDDPLYAPDFESFQKAFRKLFGKKMDDVLESIEELDAVDDIDHTYMVLGVEVNTQEREGQRYIYEFFRTLMASQTGTAADVVAWSQQTAWTQYQVDLLEWMDGVYDPINVRYLTPKPVAPAPESLPDQTTLVIKAVNDLESLDGSGDPLELGYETEITWRAIEEEVFSGLGRSGAKKNEFWWTKLPALRDPTWVPPDRDSSGWNWAVWRGPQQVSCVQLNWQSGENTWRRLTIYGAEHINHVYKGKAITTLITALDQGVVTDPALTKPQGIDDINEETGFIVPLHYTTLKKLPLVWQNEMACWNRYIIFNSYEVVKTKWWQRGFWKIIISIVAAVVVSVIFPTAGGFLGSNFAVGTAAGFTGTAALVAGAALNAFVGIVLGLAFQPVFVAVFGEEWGAIISALAGFVVGQMTFDLTGAGSISINWGNMMKADNLLAMTSSLSSGIQQYSQVRMTDMMDNFEKDVEGYESELDRIENLMKELTSGVVIDPLMFTSVGEREPDNRGIESQATFLKRTLLTGSDIASLSLGMIEHFPEMSRALPEAIE